MVTYIVALEWYDVELDKTLHPTRYYFFQSADQALEFGHKIAYGAKAWENAGEPRSVYLYKAHSLADVAASPNAISSGTYNNRNYYFDEGSNFLCAWFDCNKNQHCQ